MPQDLPNDIQYYLTTDEPLICLRVITFVDETLISITFPYSLSDVIGTADLLTAWSSVLADQIDRVPKLLGARDDAIENVGTQRDEKSKVPYILQDKQVKGFSFLVFAIRFIWDLLTRRNIQTRLVFLPARFLSHLREMANTQRSLGSESQSLPFLSDGDLITAWCSCMVIASRSGKRPAIIFNIFDLRNRLRNTFVPGGSYLQNLILPGLVLLPAMKALTTSLGHIALRIRHAIVEQATDTQARSLIRMLKASIPSMPLFGSSDSMVIVCTNWSKARFLEKIDFGPAVVTGGQPDSGEELAVQPGSCITYWGSTIGTTDRPRDTFIIYGKDSDGNHWIHGYFRPETWRLIQDAILEYQTSNT